jgi:23S rRNA (pseudouridine1915-N3)-methyltransferase
MRITLILIGKTKEKYLQDGVAEYIKRLERYVPFTCITIPDLKVSKKTETGYIKTQEGKLILQRIKGGEFVILLDERGKKYSSIDFSRYLSGLEARTGHTIFVVGGAYGFSEDIYKRSNASLSLSDMTFSHQMVRLIFTEQLYRAFTIQRGEPYHHK